MLLATSDFQRTLEEVLTKWSRQDAVVAARRAAAGDDAPDVADLWSRLVDLGALELAVPTEQGGAGGSLADLAVVLERLGHAMVPGDYLPTAAASTVLARTSMTDTVAAVLEEIAGGGVTVAVAVDGGVSAGADGRLHGVGLMIGAAEGGYALVCEQPGGAQRCYLVRVGDEGVSVDRRPTIDVTRTLSEFRLDGVQPQAELGGVTASFVRDILLTCLSAEAAGIAGWCLETAVEYAKTRHQFGQPIGSFQAIKHLCAEMAVQREEATAAAWDAASCASDPDQLELSAAAAADVSIGAAFDVAKSCIQVLGGIGYTWEHDAHLYLRRAFTARLVSGSVGALRERLALLAVGGRRRVPSAVYTREDGDEVYAEARKFADRVRLLSTERQRAALAEEGYLVPGWPRPYGRGADSATALTISVALADSKVAVPDLVIGNWLARAIVDHGDEHQQERFVWPTLRGEVAWCQLFSEPDAGSDLASVRTRASRVPGGWQLDGQKVWTSLAAEADWGLCLARTDPNAPKRKGITAFIVDMRSPGIQLRPIREMSGEARFNEVFLDAVVVPDDAVVGVVNDGWKVATSSLATERLAMGARAGLTPAMSQLLRMVTERPETDHEWLTKVGGLFARSLVKDANDRRAAVAGLAGADAGALPLVAKLTGVRLTQDEREAVLLIQGARAALDFGEQRTWVRDFLSGRALSIAGGSSQILLNMLGERVLGLPRGS